MAYHVPGTFLGPGDTAEVKTEENAYLHGGNILVINISINISVGNKGH